jgi:hypothetical protein
MEAVGQYSVFSIQFPVISNPRIEDDAGHPELLKD